MKNEKELLELLLKIFRILKYESEKTNEESVLIKEDNTLSR